MSGWRGPPPPFFPHAEHTAADRDVLSEIIPKKLFLTNYRGAENVEELQRIGCTHIAAVGAEFVDNEENHAGTALKVKFWNKDITDDEENGESMGKSLRDAALFIKKALSKKKGCVVVHCAAGISRSTTVVLGYLLLHDKKRGATLKDAFGVVQKARECVWPNDGFMGALVALELELRKKNTMTVAEYEYWGEYDGPEENTEHCGRSKAERKAAAIEVTKEAIVYHKEHHDDPLPEVQPTTTMRTKVLLKLFGMRSRKVGPA